MPSTPTFDGRDPINNSIHTFFEELESIMEWKSITVGHKKSLLLTCLRSRAKEAYERAITNEEIEHNNNPGNPAELLEQAITNYENSKAWLLATYHGPEQQAVMREALLQMKQEKKESPLAFYNRVVFITGKSGFPIALQLILVIQTWKAGLDKTIATHIGTLLNMDNEETVATAEKCWNTLNKQVS